MEFIIAIASVVVALAGVIAAFRTVVYARKTFESQVAAGQETQKHADLVQFENQFYKMLELHKANVDEIVAEDFEDNISRGRMAFEKFVSDFHSLIEHITPTIQIHNRLNGQSISATNTPTEKALLIFQGRFAYAYQIFFLSKLNDPPELLIDGETYSFAINSNLYPVVKIGWANVLSTYYRHLFMIVRHVAESKVIKERSEKMPYLKMIRAQLSNNEQLMLFYNWLANYGAAWENKENHFLTEYKMIHNLLPGDLYPHRYFSDAINGLINQYNERYGIGKLFEFQGDNPETVLQDMPL